MTTTTDNLKEDIAYVRAAAERAGARSIPSIYVLWAAISLCGFALTDFVDDSRWIGGFWLAAGPVGVCLSAWLGIRASRHAGQAEQRLGIRTFVHWLVFMAVAMLGVVLVATGHLDWAGYGSLVVLLLSLTYVQSGLHLDRRMLPIGAVVGVGYLITLFVPGYAWTLAGVLMAAALVWPAILAARTRDAAH